MNKNITIAKSILLGLMIFLPCFILYLLYTYFVEGGQLPGGSMCTLLIGQYTVVRVFFTKKISIYIDSLAILLYVVITTVLVLKAGETYIVLLVCGIWFCTILIRSRIQKSE